MRSGEMRTLIVLLAGGLLFTTWSLLTTRSMPESMTTRGTDDKGHQYVVHSSARDTVIVHDEECAPCELMKYGSPFDDPPLADSTAADTAFYVPGRDTLYFNRDQLAPSR